MAGKQFGENSLVDSAATLWVKNFVKIAQALSISKINNVFAFYAEIQENKFGKNSPVESADPLGSKILSKSLSKINTFYTGIQDGHQKWQENDFSEKSTVELDLCIRELMQIYIHRKDNSPKPVNHPLTLKERSKVNSNIRRFQAQDFV